MTSIEVIKKIKLQKNRKFDETVDLIIAVNSSKASEGSIRTDLSIPNQFGEQKKVLVLCDKSESSLAQGADFIGLEEYLEKIKTGWKEFDVVIATPTVMPKIAILGKYLGASGLMPNPKNGTVTKDLQKAIGEYKSGKVNIKSNKSGQFQVAVAKKSMEDNQILENLDYVIKHVNEDLLKSLNVSVKSIFIKSSMGPSYRLI